MNYSTVVELKTFAEAIDRLSASILQFSTASSVALYQDLVNRVAHIPPIIGVLLIRPAVPDELRMEYRAGEIDPNNVLPLLRSLDGIDKAHPPTSIRLGESTDEASTFFTLLTPSSDERDLYVGLISDRPFYSAELSQMRMLIRMAELRVDTLNLAEQSGPSDQTSVARLIGHIAHELRTPLTSLRGNVQLAMMATNRERYDRVPDRLQAAIEGVDSMTQLIQNLLDVSRLERGTYDMTPTHADLHETVEQAIETVRISTAATPRTFALAEAPSTMIEHDATAMTRTVENMLTTIVPCSLDKEPIGITISTEGAQATITLAWTGSPLHELDRRALTAPLYTRKGGKPSDHDRDDLRLELAYCRGVVTWHGGQINVTANAEGTNQVVQIDIPLRQY